MKPKPDKKPSGQTIFLGIVVVLAVVFLSYVFLAGRDGVANGVGRRGELQLADIPFDGQSSYAWLQRICAIGPRVSGSAGMARQQQMLERHFRQLGGDVQMQTWNERHPQTGQPVPMNNMIVSWHPDRLDRILLCAHYDTRPFPDRDRQNPRGTFLGANDGASGTALLCELARHMPGFQSRYGVDFVLFDGEELVYDSQRDRYFLGSEHFARGYRNDPPAHRYRWAVLLDMVGDAELHLYQERNSMRWPDTRPLVTDIWKVARRLRVKEFVPRIRHEVRDDHLALHNIAGIPACDIIDFDYPRPGRISYWHTEQDVPENCSALSLAKVGWVLVEWLKQVDQSLPVERKR